MKIPRISKYGGTNLAAFVFDFTLLLILDFILDIERALIAFFCYISGTLVSYVLAKILYFLKVGSIVNQRLNFLPIFLEE
ncbi:MAG: hypothetical protein CM15mP12_1480 [Gammaproteobacteria bacterium]|nr:MAG: hypothetical protein CM15mP12_1480 [Gammaproteobacteria bacterium]